MRRGRARSLHNRGGRRRGGGKDGDATVGPGRGRARDGADGGREKGFEGGRGKTTGEKGDIGEWGLLDGGGGGSGEGVGRASGTGPTGERREGKGHTGERGGAGTRRGSRGGWRTGAAGRDSAGAEGGSEEGERDRRRGTTRRGTGGLLGAGAGGARKWAAAAGNHITGHRHRRVEGWEHERRWPTTKTEAEEGREGERRAGKGQRDTVRAEREPKHGKAV